jgi:uroporphyrinogen decarboxylase
MTSRQRMLTALDLGKPDRLPASVHDWMQYYLDNYLGGIAREQAFTGFGLDWAIYATPALVDEASPSQWNKETRVELIDGGPRRREYTRITTSKNTMTQTVERDKYNSPWITEYLCKDKDDIFDLIEHQPAERYNLDEEARILDGIGDNGILRGGRIGPWHRLCELYGVKVAIYETYDDPLWVANALMVIAQKDIDFLGTMRGTKMDLLETGGGHNSSTVISPGIFERFILPEEKLIHDFARNELGLRTVYHICGGMMPMLGSIVDLHPTAIETLTPPAMGGDADLREIKRVLGDEMCLIGGFDQYNGFENASPEDTAKMVRRCFEEAGEGGGYILNPSDHFFDCPVENLKAYTEAARECVYS